MSNFLDARGFTFAPFMHPSMKKDMVTAVRWSLQHQRRIPMSNI